MTFSELISLANEDLQKPEESRLTDAALETPVLYSRWLDIWLMENSEYTRIKAEVELLKRQLMRYYGGRMTKKEWEGIGKEYQWQENPSAKQIETYVASDPLMYDRQTELENQASKVKYAENVIDAVKQRGWSIKHAIDAKKFFEGS